MPPASLQREGTVPNPLRAPELVVPIGVNVSLETWYQKIEEAVEDWDVRRAFADWLEENGHKRLAAGQRWQAENQKRPLEDQKRAPRFLWLRTDEKWKREIQVPEDIFSVMAHEGVFVIGFDTLQEAELALAEALEKSRENWLGQPEA